VTTDGAGDDLWIVVNETLLTLIGVWPDTTRGDDRPARPDGWTTTSVPHFLMALQAHLDRNVAALPDEDPRTVLARSLDESRHLLDPDTRARLEAARRLDG